MSLTLLQLAMQSGVRRFIFGSSISAYGARRYADFGEVSETERASPDNVYGVSKRFVEIVGEQYRQQGKLQFVSLRMAMVVGQGVVTAASPWRSEIFEKLRARQPAHLHLPFDRQEIVPLIHVADVAEITRRLTQAEQPRHSIYNTPSENWKCGDLADYIRELNPNIEVTFGPPSVRGDPEAITGQRFVDEFGFRPASLKQRLRQAVENGGE